MHTLHVALDPDNMAKKLSEKYTALVKALQEVQGINAQKDPGAALETVGNAVTDILEAVFGADDTRVIVEFYNGHYMEMCTEVMPFVTATVIPAVRRIARENKKVVAAGYNRKQRRLFGKK